LFKRTQHSTCSGSSSCFCAWQDYRKKALKQTGENKGSSRENKKLTILAGTQMRFWHMTNK